MSVTYRRRGYWEPFETRTTIERVRRDVLALRLRGADYGEIDDPWVYWTVGEEGLALYKDDIEPAGLKHLPMRELAI